MLIGGTDHGVLIGAAHAVLIGGGTWRVVRGSTWRVVRGCTWRGLIALVQSFNNCIIPCYPTVPIFIKIVANVNIFMTIIAH